MDGKTIVGLLQNGKYAEAKSELRSTIKSNIDKRVAASKAELGLHEAEFSIEDSKVKERLAAGKLCPACDKLVKGVTGNFSGPEVIDAVNNLLKDKFGGKVAGAIPNFEAVLKGAATDIVGLIKAKYGKIEMAIPSLDSVNSGK